MTSAFRAILSLVIFISLMFFGLIKFLHAANPVEWLHGFFFFCLGFLGVFVLVFGRKPVRFLKDE